MKYKYLFTNGDSWTWGQGLQEDQLDGIPRGQWPEVLGNKLNLKVINIAENGSSNERIFRSTMEWVIENKDKIEDTIIVIGWTVSDRWEWWDNFEKSWTKCYANHGGDTLTYKMSKKWWTDFYTRFFDIDKMSYKSIVNIISLQNFLKQNKCNYIFFQGFDQMFNFTDDKKLYSQLDYDNIIITENYDSMDSFLRYKFEDYNDAIENIHGHPNREAHKLWAEELYKIMEVL